MVLKETAVKFCDLIIFAGCLGAASTSSALSLGSSQGNVLLGSPVDLVFNVQADPGQTAESSCLRAEVWLGDMRLGSSQVQLQLMGDSSVRVRTSHAVNEPLVNVKLSAGCAGAVSRSYTFFADPPVSMAASVQPIDLSTLKVASLPLPASSLATAPLPRALATGKTKTQPAKRRVTAQTIPNGTIPLPPIEELSRAATGLAAVAAAAPSNASDSSEQSKLRMEALEGLVASDADIAPAPTPATENLLISNTGSDPNTQLLFDANAQRLEQLEQQLRAMQSKLSSSHAEISSLTTQLAQEQNTGLPLWVHVMLGLLALALATIAWLIQRMKQERAPSEEKWADTVLAAQDGPPSSPQTTSAPVMPVAMVAAQEAQKTSSHWESALPTSEQLASDVSATPLSQTVDVYPDVNGVDSSDEDIRSPQADNSIATTAPSTVSASTSTEQAQASWATVLTAQALFDIQEQAEFYASVGEHDQAILLLEEHIAQHETSSPLAYLELLQLLYRLSRAEAFEHVRNTFQKHFNVQVPSFLRFARKGHDLWSSHPDVLSNIEAIWPTDDVLPLLRRLIIANLSSTHSDAGARFDLAAFDDLLMLYNVAQTTPATARGTIVGRLRTAPTEVPLPEVFSEEGNTIGHTEFMPDDLFLKRSTYSSVAPPPAPEPLPLQTASLEMLNAAPAAAPLSANAPRNDSPFQRTSHFESNEVLMDELTIDWEQTADTMASVSELPTPAPIPSSPLLQDPLLNDSGLGDLNLDDFMFDERDLPPKPSSPSKKISP